MSKLFNQVLNVCKELDSIQKAPRNVEFLTGSIINDAFFPALMIQKDEQRLATADPNREAWLNDNGFDSEQMGIEQRIADNTALMTQVISVVQRINYYDVPKIIREKVAWRMTKQDNPYVSERKVEAWVDAGIDREEAIKIELKKSEDFLSDWAHYGKAVEQYLLRAYSEDLAFDYPETLNTALANRLVQMRRFLKKYPHPSTISFLPECEELLATC